MAAVAAVDFIINQKDAQKCSGMYSKRSWGGSITPSILVKFIKNGDERNKDIEDPVVGVVVWEWKDTLLLGKPESATINEVGRTSSHVE